MCLSVTVKQKVVLIKTGELRNRPPLVTAAAAVLSTMIHLNFQLPLVKVPFEGRAVPAGDFSVSFCLGDQSDCGGSFTVSRRSEASIVLLLFKSICTSNCLQIKNSL